MPCRYCFRPLCIASKAKYKYLPKWAIKFNNDFRRAFILRWHHRLSIPAARIWMPETARVRIRLALTDAAWIYCSCIEYHSTELVFAELSFGMPAHTSTFDHKYETIGIRLSCVLRHTQTHALILHAQKRKLIHTFACNSVGHYSTFMSMSI